MKSARGKQIEILKDAAVLIQAGENPTFLRESISLFLEIMPDLIADINYSNNNLDFKNMTKTASKINEASAAIGATRLRVLSEIIRAAGPEYSKAERSELVFELESEFLAVQSELLEFILKLNEEQY